MKKQFRSEVIFNKKENKAQGVLMQEEEPNYIPEIIGLSKIQLFCFILFAMILGVAFFGLGTHINKTTFNKAKETEFEYKKIIFENVNIKDQETFILFGSFIDPENAKMLQTKIENKTGKTCILIQKPNCINVILGPFSSKEIAFNEMKLIEFKTQVSGSLIYAI